MHDAVDWRCGALSARASEPTGFVSPGGGVFIGSSDPITLTNNLIAHNLAAAEYGGGVYVDHDLPAGTVLMVNNTIADNGASGVVVNRNANVTATNNIVAGHGVGVANRLPTSSVITADHNLLWNTSDPVVGSDAIQEDPQFAPGYLLLAGSPAVDAGTPIAWLTVDLQGNPRPQGAGYDIGAFEGTVPFRLLLPLVVRGAM